MHVDIADVGQQLDVRLVELQCPDVEEDGLVDVTSRLGPCGDAQGLVDRGNREFRREQYVHILVAQIIARRRGLYLRRRSAAAQCHKQAKEG